MAETFGKWCENFVAKRLGYRRVPFSGSVWPNKEDLTREERRHGEHPARRHLAQVKGSHCSTLTSQWLSLRDNAQADLATPHLYHVEVVDGGQTAMLFEIKLLESVALGVGGDE